MKTAVRELTTPIADLTTSNTLVSWIISGNQASYTSFDGFQEGIVKS